MTNTSPFHDGLVPVNPSKERTSEWLYNEIMRFVQPELMTDHLPLLDLKYSGENTFERAARLLSYEEAFEVFDAIAKSATQPLMEEGRKVMLRHREKVLQEEQTENAATLQALEHSFHQTT